MTPLRCLTTTDTKLPLKLLHAYTIQHKPLFPLNAEKKTLSATAIYYPLQLLFNDVVVGPGCLTTTNTKVHQKLLLSYTLQHKPLFHVEAVRFLTIKNKVICSDPSSAWAIKSMNYLDAKNKKRRSVSNKTAHQSVTAVPVNTSTTNRTRLSSQI
ncbi:uncharacterized protein xcl32a.1 [Garra rufa]|uniref:uncharacterized protein xcl32a.1 n=1 Tax=Garra rufa TaxID=137080 RepID=UPI003CCEF82F